MNIAKYKNKISISSRIAACALLLIVEVPLGYFGLKYLLVNEHKSFIKDLSAVISNDIKYEDDHWDISSYNSNPLTPTPSASSLFPLYVIGSDGFLIERSAPIAGFLDTSDAKQLLEFENAQTVKTSTNETWRIRSKAIESKGDIVGTIVVALHTPEEEVLAKIDEKLGANIGVIEKSITWKDNDLDVSDLDIRNIDHNISFKVVSRYNKVVLNKGRVPSFIDPSYVSKEIAKKHFRVVTDSNTQEEFLVLSTSITDSENNPVGVVIVGQSLTSTKKILSNYLLFTSIINLILMIPLALLYIYNVRHAVNSALDSIEDEWANRSKRATPETIKFDAKEAVIMLDSEEVKIHFDTNQYYICKYLFGSPKRKWEQDELLEKLGDDFSNGASRKAYDAMTAINKKLGLKLIIYQDKKYQFNPELLDIILNSAKK